MIRECKKHGSTEYFSSIVKGKHCGWRCRKCASEAVIKRRRVMKELLVKEAGGKCFICGYNKYMGALNFHHLDPKQKDFSLSAGNTTRGIETLRKEAAKCILLCVRCHAEVEAGIVILTE